MLSCEDDTPAPGQPSICQISHFEVWEAKVCNGDTIKDVIIINVSYDSNGRLVKWASEYDEEYQNCYEFFYDSSGKLDSIYGNDYECYKYTWSANMVLEEVVNPSNELEHFNEIEINNNDEIVRIDRYNAESVKTRYWLLTWANNNATKIDYYQSNSAKNSNDFDFSEAGTLKKLFNNFNIDKKPKKKDISTVQDDGFYLHSTTEYSYDNKNNPFRHHSALSLWGKQDFMSQNNIKKIVRNNYDNPEYNYTETYTMEYNSNNYPKVYYTTTEIDNDCYWLFKIKFYYNNCE